MISVSSENQFGRPKEKELKTKKSRQNFIFFSKIAPPLEKILDPPLPINGLKKISHKTYSKCCTKSFGAWSCFRFFLHLQIIL